VSFLLITSDYGDIRQNNPSKKENKTVKTHPSLFPANMATTEPADHKDRIYMDVFLQPDVLKI
jgi:hypothetical protein